MRSSGACLCVAAVMLVALPACGRSRPAVAPVGGRITLAGRPVTTGVVCFYPDAGRPATGVIGSDGRYTLGTFTQTDGALLGSHRVVIEAREAAAARPRPAATASPPPAKSPPPADMPEEMKKEWVAGTLGPSDGKIKWLVPEMYAGAATSPLRATVERGQNTIDFDLPSP